MQMLSSKPKTTGKFHRKYSRGLSNQNREHLVNQTSFKYKSHSIYDIGELTRTFESFNYLTCIRFTGDRSFEK